MQTGLKSMGANFCFITLLNSKVGGSFSAPHDERNESKMCIYTKLFFPRLALGWVTHNPENNGVI